ncbi:30S ribosomal protein S24e [Methanolobus psychrophilus R15]|nr:30S ribosomal protein S24e [Methanolobus psychrophilus R15]
MDIKITKDNTNALLNRREMNFSVTYEGPTPARSIVRGKIAAMLNVPLDLVVVHKMGNEFGRQALEAYVKIYETEERMKQIENKYILERNTVPEPEAKEE